nr:MAG TPA: hypothetical protein [Caudoviricetes sp.]
MFIRYFPTIILNDSTISCSTPSIIIPFFTFILLLLKK